MSRLQPIVIVGAGDYAREVHWLIDCVNAQSPRFNLLGYVDDDEATWGKEIQGKPVLGPLDWLAGEGKGQACYTIGIGEPRLRRLLDHRLVDIPVAPPLVHPSAQHSRWVELGEGCQLTAGVVLTVNITVGRHALLNIGAMMGHDSVLGDYVNLNPDVQISGNVTIEEGADLGVGSTVNPDLRIGRWSIVGASAAVVGDLPAGVTAVGVPAKIIKQNDDLPS